MVRKVLLVSFFMALTLTSFKIGAVLSDAAADVFFQVATKARYEYELYIVEPPTEPTTEEQTTAVRTYNIPLSDELQRHTIYLCEQYSVPVRVAFAVMYYESRYNPTAISEDGRDFGLMQIRDVNHEWLKAHGVHDVMNAKQNILGGVIILSKAIDANSTMNRALMAYNFGQTGAERCFAKGVYSTEYSMKVMDYAERIAYNEVD